MTLLFFISFFFFFFTITITTSTPPHPPPPPYPYGLSYHINSGTSANSTDSFNTTWFSDRFFSIGSSALVSHPLNFPLPSEKTLCFFPPSSYGKKNCYTFPSLPFSSRYLLRTFTVYDNYDAKSRPPSFDVALSSIVLFSWRSPWPESTAANGAYSDLSASLSNTSSSLDLCFYGFATDAPLISSIDMWRKENRED